jgi:hypothetical protein
MESTSQTAREATMKKVVMLLEFSHLEDHYRKKIMDEATRSSGFLSVKHMAEVPESEATSSREPTVAEKILSLLSQSKKGLTTSQIANSLGKNVTYVYKVLEMLKLRKDVKKRGDKWTLSLATLDVGE